MLRRKWRKDGRYTVRVTCTGKVSVMLMPLHKDMKTEAQLKCRARFVKAQQLMLEALKDKKKLHFFQKKRLRYNYKTLRGCMLAHYMEELAQKEICDTRNALGNKMIRSLTDAEKIVGNVSSTSTTTEQTESNVANIIPTACVDNALNNTEMTLHDVTESPPE